jgi:hypothetical protein
MKWILCDSGEDGGRVLFATKCLQRKRSKISLNRSKRLGEEECVIFQERVFLIFFVTIWLQIVINSIN